MERSGGRLADLLALAEASLRRETGMLVLAGLHCDLTFMTNYTTARPKGLLRLLPEPPLVDIANVISTKDREWRVQGALQVAWVMPYVPNFVLYNRRRARLLGIGELCSLHEDEGQWAEQAMRIQLQQLTEKLRSQGLLVVEMAPLVPLLTTADGSDGVHMGPLMQNDVFDAVLREAWRQVPTLPPSIGGGRVLSVTERWLRRQQRQRHRRNRRARTLRGPSLAMGLVGSSFIRQAVARPSTLTHYPASRRLFPVEHYPTPRMPRP